MFSIMFNRARDLSLTGIIPGYKLNFGGKEIIVDTSLLKIGLIIEKLVISIAYYIALWNPGVV